MVADLLGVFAHVSSILPVVPVDKPYLKLCRPSFLSNDSDYLSHFQFIEVEDIANRLPIDSLHLVSNGVKRVPPDSGLPFVAIEISEFLWPSVEKMRCFFFKKTINVSESVELIKLITDKCENASDDYFYKNRHYTESATFRASLAPKYALRPRYRGF